MRGAVGSSNGMDTRMHRGQPPAGRYTGRAAITTEAIAAHRVMDGAAASRHPRGKGMV